MKLFLDDLRFPTDDSWSIVRDAENAISFLAMGVVEEISFDHDLGEPAMTGYDVAKYIEEEVFYGRMKLPKWKIHSANPVGEANIKACMLKAEEYARQSDTKTS